MTSLKKRGFLCLLLLLFWTSPAAGDDTSALISLKNSIVQDPSGLLGNWKLNSNSSSPCSWTGVSCVGGRVTGLDLSKGRLIGRFPIEQLMAVENLKTVHLFGNLFFGNLSTTGAASSSCNLETLDLSSNNFSEPIAESFFRSCSGLVSVNLSHNSIPGGDFLISSSLRQLDLSRNSISGHGLLKDLVSGCRNLNQLNLSDNRLAGGLEGISASSCQNLSVLDLSYNLITGEIPLGFVSQLPSSVSHLDLSHNNLSGDFSEVDFGECGNLTVLDFSYNNLGGAGFPASFANCRRLEKLDLTHNSIGDRVPTLFGSFSNLGELLLGKNQFFGEIPPELGQICKTLRVLDLSYNKLTGGVPSTFVGCSSLLRLRLGQNQLSGDFLHSVVSTMPNLKELSVPFNNITGSIPLSLSNCTQLEVIGLGSNEFTGNIPSGFCSSLGSLRRILLPNNNLTGLFPMELGNCKSLQSIDLSFNDLIGSVPLSIWSLPELLDLVLWANRLTGEIPDSICSHGGKLESLILNNNLISGVIPPTLTSCLNLMWVSLSNNRLTGEMPTGFERLQSLSILQLGNNSITGEIPPELGNCRNLIWLDLNSNNLTGPVPPSLANQAGQLVPGEVSGKQFAFVRNEGGTACRGAGGLLEFEGIREDRLSNFPMVHSCPSTRIYTGTTVYTFTSNNGSMIYLDLSYNTLSGTIPDKFGSMYYLQVLNLGHNKLTGPIPDSLGGLKGIGVLDLSYNNFGGGVPGSLGTLTFLSDFDVSNNNLTGPIPSSGQLTTFPPSRYENNSGLCGVPLPACGSSPRNRLSPGSGRKRQSMAGSVVIGIAVAMLFILALSLVLIKVRRNQRSEEHREQYVDSLPTSASSSWKLSGVLEPLSINVATFEKPLRKLTFAHLLEATNGFSADSLIGSGGFGEVYKAQLKDGCTVAIKKLVRVTGQGDREFTAEMETIGKIKHRNLVPLLGYCKIGDERLLVYDYMRWGSLETVLHDRKFKGGILNLDWTARKKIAIGSARGLAFLHHSCIPHIIHRDMKSSNVLLDENLEARVSDFGMARLMNALDTHLSVSTLAGTPGYVPPEYYQSFRCTTKGDVYSYGVVLLELLSGKRPIDPNEFGDNNLVGWAKQLVREKRSTEIFDPELTGSKSGEAELYQYLKIACECLDDRPLRRPTMIQVMAMFKELQMDSESDILDGFSLKECVIEETKEKDP